jgi:hypothetical protein
MSAIEIAEFHRLMKQSTRPSSPSGAVVSRAEAQRALVHLQRGGYDAADKAAVRRELTSGKHLSVGARGVLRAVLQESGRSNVLAVKDSTLRANTGEAGLAWQTGIHGHRAEGGGFGPYGRRFWGGCALDLLLGDERGTVRALLREPERYGFNEEAAVRILEDAHVPAHRTIDRDGMKSLIALLEWRAEAMVERTARAHARGELSDRSRDGLLAVAEVMRKLTADLRTMAKVFARGVDKVLVGE